MSFLSIKLFREKTGEWEWYLMRRQYFLVAVETIDILEPSVVKNYVNMAIRKYEKVNSRENKVSYFDGVHSPGFFIEEIFMESEEGDSRKENIVREAARIVLTIRGKTQEFVDKIEMK